MNDKLDELERLTRENKELRQRIEELTRAEAEHRRAEQEYRAILENTGSATVVVDSNYRIIKANPEFAKLAGVGVKELERDRRWTEFMIPEEVERLTGYARLRRKNPTEAPRHYEFAMLDPQGRKRDIYMTAAMIPGTDYNVASMTDVTPLREAEHARMESEISFATAFHHLPHPSVITEIKTGLFLEVNKAFEALTGYGAVELAGKTSLQMGLWREPAERETVVDLLLREGQVQGYERDLRTSSGRLRHVAMWAVTLTLAGEKRMLSIYVDLTEQRDQQRFQDAVMATATNLGLGIFIEGDPLTDNAGLMYVNRALADLVGMTPDDLIEHKRLRDLVHPVSRAKMAKRLGDLRAGLSRPDRFDIHLVEAGGGTRMVEVSLSASELEGRLAVVGFCHDVTLARKMEKQVKTSQRMEALGSLAGGIAHDFNNILMAVCGYAELALMAGPKHKKVRESLEQVVKASDRGRDLVRQIITFSRGDSVTGHPISASRLAGETLKLVEASLPPNIRLKYSLDAANDTVLADPSHINQIVMNLCSNASHALGKTGGEIAVSLVEEVIDREGDEEVPGLDAGNYLKLMVADNGSGIAPDIMDQIFDPFFTTKAAGEGTGMGLSVVHGLVQGLGGAIKVKSIPDVRTEFRIWLPLTRQGAPTDQPASSSLPMGRENILVVEDEAPLAEVMQSMLEDLGYSVAVAANGEEGLACFQEDPDAFDLVVTDQSMPQMTGIDMARRIKQLRPDAPVILATGYGGGVSKKASRELGLAGVIYKPYRIVKLAQLIRRALDSQDGGGS